MYPKSDIEELRVKRAIQSFIFREEGQLADCTNRSMFQIIVFQSNLEEFSKIAIKNDCLVIAHYLTTGQVQGKLGFLSVEGFVIRFSNAVSCIH